VICPQCGTENPEGAKFCNECAAPLVEATPRREQRKTVTVLFCDVTGSTALGERLDPETLRGLLARYFEQMKAIVERHGGTVEKFIGDAVMAVFGVPVVHEDDALRALRAAVEMREAFPALGIHGRIGITTGEVVTGTEERLATGDAVNVAARLEQVALPGEVLIGEATLALVRSSVQAEAVEPLELKGKSEPIQAYRVGSVASEVARSPETPMVGRGPELDRLRDAFEQAVRDRSCQLFTILGTAGVGKSRLASEFLATVEVETVVRGRCLSYGEGITYWPVVEVLKQLQERPADGTAAAAIAALLGELDAPSTPDEMAWATRKTLEQAAAERPLVCVFDELHWGEPAFLDLVDHVADFSRDAPILLLCLARPELLDRRPGWAGGKLNATSVLLEPLSATETDELIERLLAEHEIAETLRARIREAAEGNPLFVEEMLAMVRESPDGDVVVPPTIQALLAARLDQLEISERTVLERGAVEGKVFHLSAVEALAPEEPQVPARLQALVRKELVRPDRGQLPGDDAFRFRHLLIRDAAYDALPKSTRVELHERFAIWLEERGPDLVELDEIVGYHLEQACRYRAELALAGDEKLAGRARERLTAAGRRALLRQDHRAAVNLLQRAAALVLDDEIEVSLDLDLVEALFYSGQVEESYRHAREAAERAAAAGERAAEFCCRLEEAMVRVNFDPEGATEQLGALAHEAIPLFEAARDDLGLYTAYHALASVGHMHAQMGAELEALDRALVHARRTGLPHHEARLTMWLGAARFHGTTPVPDALAWFDEQGARGSPILIHRIFRAHLLAMLGQIEEGRAAAAAARADMEDRGATMALALANGLGSAELELTAGNPAVAAEFGAEGCRMFEEVGERGFLSTAAGVLARALYELDRLEEAEEWAGRAAELGASDDAATQMLWRQVQAKVLARRGDRAKAERLAREAVEVADATDMLNAQGYAYSDLAEVLRLAGRTDEARAALEHTLALHERKANLVMADRTRARLKELQRS
jgi:class 3 adenylate cyclase/tetratricopeptide (TPR) repeat protein